MKKLTQHQRATLRWMIDFAKRHHGVGPMQRHFEEETGSRVGAALLMTLEKRGYIAHPYDGSPWQPILDEDGNPLNLTHNNLTQQATP